MALALAQAVSVNVRPHLTKPTAQQLSPLD